MLTKGSRLTIVVEDYVITCIVERVREKSSPDAVEGILVDVAPITHENRQWGGAFNGGNFVNGCADSAPVVAATPSPLPSPSPPTPSTPTPTSPLMATVQPLVAPPDPKVIEQIALMASIAKVHHDELVRTGVIGVYTAPMPSPSPSRSGGGVRTLEYDSDVPCTIPYWDGVCTNCPHKKTPQCVAVPYDAEEPGTRQAKLPESAIGVPIAGVGTPVGMHSAPRVTSHSPCAIELDLTVVSRWERKSKRML